LSINLYLPMKKLPMFVLTSLLSCFSLHIFSQDLTGLWTGSLYNDTTKSYLPYQLAISDDDGKLTGYSYTVFNIDGKEEVGVKKVKLKKKDDKYLIEDNGFVFNDYAAPPPKGVHQLSIVSLITTDTMLTLTGGWQTNRTKIYRPLTGTIEVNKKGRYDTLALFKKLKELKLDNTLSFTPKPIKTEPSDALAAAKKKDEDKLIAAAEKKAAQDAKDAEDKKRKEEKLIAEAEKKKAKDAEEKRRLEEKATADAEKKAAKAIADAEKKAAKDAEEKKRQEEKLIAAAEKKAEKEREKNITKTTITTVANPPAQEVMNRKIVNTQEVFFKSDSLILTLYDNGEVDGDIVTVLMNGEIFMPNVALTTKPVRKTIYIDKNTPDSLQLVMFAENLGSIPPNTGLLVVNDGNDVYEVRFSADLHTNSAILLRRKKRLE